MYSRVHAIYSLRINLFYSGIDKHVNVHELRLSDYVIDNKLLTYIWCFALCIPAVFGVVCHFIAHVLTEPQPLWIDSNSNKKLVDTTNVVP